MTPIDPARHYVHLAADGTSTAVPGGDAFWALPATALDRYGQGWLVSEFECIADWPMWEMHPGGDEFVYLLGGRVTMILEVDRRREQTELSGRAAMVIPRGVWHTASVLVPSRMLFVTRGIGTQHRKA
jgi:mannose-6-phosphate isomerase-like protein (cupin superfamily)